MAINVFVKSGGTVLDDITATPNNVLTNKTYNDSEGEVQTGTMPNNGAINKAIDVDEEFNSGAGYYSSINITGPTLSGTATSEQVLSGYSFYNTTGTKETGSMTNRGQVTCNLNYGGTYTGDGGYYSSITVNCTWTVYTKTQQINGNFCNTGVTATGYYGISTTYSATHSIKIFTSAGYVWMTRNAGTGSATARIVKIWS